MDEVHIPVTTKQAKVIGLVLGFLMVMPVILGVMNPVWFGLMVIGTVLLIISVCIIMIDFMFSRTWVFKE